MHLDIAKEINRQALFKHSPELVGVVADIRFYECAIHGDERPLIAVTADRCGYSYFYDLPSLNDLID